MRGRGVGLHGGFEVQTEGLVDYFPAGHVRPVDEGDGDAGVSRAARPADAVHVGGVGVGALVVDHVADAGDVDSPGGDVGCHQDGHGPGPELLQGTFSGDLVQVAVDGRGGETALLQFIRQALRGPFRSAENHHLAGIAGLGDAGDHLGFVQVVGLVHELGDVGHRRLGIRALGANVHGPVQSGTGQGEDGGRHRRREQEALTRRGCFRQQFLDVGQETEVQHLVGLVQHQHLDVAQVQRTAVG